MFEKKKNLAWLICSRLVVISLFLASITYFNIRQPDFFPDEMLRVVTRLIIITYCFSIFSLIALRLPPVIVNAVSYSQIVWEILFVTILLIVTGGISSTYAFLFNLAIINASFLFGRREALYTAGVCGIIYGSVIDLHYFGRLEKFGLFYDSGGLFEPNHVLSLIFTNLLAFFLTALLTGYLAERARTSEKALKVKEVDYEDLERVNSLIVSTLDSGLVTVNSEGRIRVFNRYATELTGIDQDKAYDVPLKAIFPFMDLSHRSMTACREEFIFDRGGDLRNLGIKIAPLQDRDGNTLGAIIDIQDRTGIREMETRLKKADRLAAIGELSARIAHEVRNPLASISGSVQLIAESHAIPDSDRNLLEIVLRETSRLDKMVNEFLHYARPTPPVMTWFPLKPLIEETILLLKGDSRFDAVRIYNSTDEVFSVFADFSQMKQVIWNLMLNAAEAMTGGGDLSIASLRLEDSVEIVISDSGKGISERNMSLLFEPFFTTKSGGSGLGLATVYRIIEAHHGSISVDSVPGKGSWFKISLPFPANYTKGDEAFSSAAGDASKDASES